MVEAALGPANPIGDQPCFGNRAVLWTWVLVGSAAMTLYGLTMAPDLLWGDSGEAQLRVLTDAIRGDRSLARAHCTYYAAAIAIREVFNMEAARAANLTAALAGAVTVANFAALIAKCTTRWVTIIASCIALMCSHTLWQMSTGAEVITFYTMFMTAELFAVLCFFQSGKCMWMVIAALMNGLALSTHNFAMLIWPAYAVAIVIALRSRMLSMRWLSIAAAAWLVGACPLIAATLLEWRRVGSSVAALESLLFGGFQAEVLNASISLRSILQLCVMGVYNFPTPLLLAVPVGFVVARRLMPRAFLYFATIGGAVLLLFVARYNVADQYTFMAPVYIVLAVFMAMGIDWAIQSRPSRVVSVIVIALAALGPVVFAVTPAIVRQYASNVIPDSTKRVPYRDPFEWFFQPWRCGYSGARQYADEVLASLPPSAVLIVLDTMRPPLDYLQGHDGRRLDVYLSNSHFAWPGRERREATRENTDAMVNAGMLYVASPVEGYVSTWMLNDKYDFIADGLVYRVVFRDRAD